MGSLRRRETNFNKGRYKGRVWYAQTHLENFLKMRLWFPTLETLVGSYWKKF